MIRNKAKLEIWLLKLIYKVGKKLHISNIDITRKLMKQPIKAISSISDELADRIESGKPMLLARLGGTEGRVAGEYCERMLGMREHYSQDLQEWLYTTSGFFADDYEDKELAMDEYAKMTLEGIGECDYLSALFPERVYMPFLFKYYARKTTTATDSDFGPHFTMKTDKTWLRGLKNKKVLVVNSFARSIEYQYSRKEKLVRSKEYELPEFTLRTYQTLVTQCGERPHNFKNFFEAYDKMLDDIKKIDFDVALVGAGAYGFPLSVELKKMGKIVIETCGHTPLFFGVYGERDVRQGIAEYMTDAWIRPIEEKPKAYKKVEDGCYW